MKISNVNINFKKMMSLILTFGIVLSPSSLKAESNKSIKKIHSQYAVGQNIKYSFDYSLLKSGVCSQKNELWNDWKCYGNQTIGVSGCSFLSIVNALSLAFGIHDEEEIAMILNDIIKLDGKYVELNKYFLGKSINHNYEGLNNLLWNTNGEIRDFDNKTKVLLSQIEDYKDNDNLYYMGSISFKKDNYQNIIDALNKLYEINPDTNVIMYRMSAGTLSLGSPFGSKSDSGHYVTLLFNAREFVEKNVFYLIDSLNKNLKEEDIYNIDYNFAQKPNIKKYGSIVNFNRAYEVKRINDEILKLQYKDGKIDKKGLSLLGFNGSCGIIVCPDKITIKENIYRLNNNAFYNYKSNKVLSKH